MWWDTEETFWSRNLLSTDIIIYCTCTGTVVAANFMLMLIMCAKNISDHIVFHYVFCVLNTQHCMGEGGLPYKIVKIKLQ